MIVIELLNFSKGKLPFCSVKVLFCIVLLGYLCNGFTIDLRSEPEHNSTVSTAWKRFPFDLSNDGTDIPAQNRAKVIEYLSRDIIGKVLVSEWEKKVVESLILTTRNTHGQITDVQFAHTDQLTMKDVLFLLQFFPLLFPDAMEPINFHIPMNGKKLQIALRRDGSGFTAFHGIIDLLNINVIIRDLHEAFKIIQEPTELPRLLVHLYNATLDKNSFGNSATGPEERAIIGGLNFVFSTSILRQEIPRGIPVWLKQLNDDLEVERMHLEKKLSKFLEGVQMIPLRYELAANMVKTADYYRFKWQELIDDNVIVVQPKTYNKYTTVTVNPTSLFTLRDFFKLLQYSLFFDLEGTVAYRVPIGGKERTFYLQKASQGDNQILVQTKGEDWIITGSSNLNAPTYDDMIELLGKVKNQSKMAEIMARAILNTTDNQPDFEGNILQTNSFSNNQENTKAVQRMVEFMVITMVAEAAAPSETVKYLFTKKLAEETSFPTNKFNMPHLEKLGQKSGRTLTIDDVVLAKLDDMASQEKNITNAFSTETFPIRMKGGTQKGREYVYNNGDMLIPSYLIKNSARDITTNAIKSCTRS